MGEYNEHLYNEDESDKLTLKEYHKLEAMKLYERAKKFEEKESVRRINKMNISAKAKAHLRSQVRLEEPWA